MGQAVGRPRKEPVQDAKSACVDAFNRLYDQLLLSAKEHDIETFRAGTEAGREDIALYIVSRLTGMAYKPFLTEPPKSSEVEANNRLLGRCDALERMCDHLIDKFMGVKA